MENSSAEKDQSTKTSQADPFVLKSLEDMRKKLLDLTGRNRLLNFPIHQHGQTLRIIDEVPDQLFGQLTAEKEMRFVPVPSPTRDELVEHGYLKIDDETGQEIRLKKDPSAEEWARILGLDTSYDLPRGEHAGDEDKHKDDAIQVLLFPPQMESRLRNIRNKAQTAIEEMGASILYLAIGFLEWQEQGSSQKKRLAPLFTIPVSLSRGKLDQRTGTYQYRLSYTAEDILPNLSLKEKLYQDFHLALPDIEDGTYPEQYLDEVSKLIEKNQPEWKVRRFGALTLLNFGKMLMYLDLDPERWPEGTRNITAHPIVNRFFSSQKNERAGADGGSSPDEHLIDEIETIHEEYPLIDDADSSQHSALIDAVNGENLVVEGPPGTGKSQTITNLIAAAMLNGKKVLFVAEKMAALDVVKARLDKAGLGDFCLELHSHKSQKRKVLEDINTRLTKQNSLRSTATIDAEIAQYEQRKDRLNRYAGEINEHWGKTGLTIHDIFSGAARYRRELDVDPIDVHIEGLSGAHLSDVRRLELENKIKDFQDIYREMLEQLGSSNDLYDHPWSGVENTNIQLFDCDRVVGVLKGWQAALDQLVELGSSTARNMGFDSSALHYIEHFRALALDCADLPELSAREYFDALANLNEKNQSLLEQTLAAHASIQERFATLQHSIHDAKLRNLNAGTPLPSFPDIASAAGASKDETLEGLIKATVDIKQIEADLTEISSGDLLNLKQALPESLKSLIRPSKSGFEETLEFLEVATSLPSRLMSFRCELMDSEEYDSALSDLNQDIEWLYPLRAEILELFSENRLPDSGKLEQVHFHLSRTGIAKYFTSAWWRARKLLKEMRKDPTLKPSQLFLKLNKAIEYQAGREAFDKKNLEARIGPNFKGLDTDIESLSETREWYRKVRQTYGVGFGPKVALGNELLSLDTNVLRGMHHLREQGTLERLGNLLALLSSQEGRLQTLKERIAQGDDLIGEDGILQNFQNQLKSALETTLEWVEDRSLALAETQKVTNELQQLSKDLAEFKNSQILRSIFGDEVGLKTGPGVDNENTLTAIRETLDLASFIYKQLRFEPLRQCLIQINGHETYRAFKTEANRFLNQWHQYEEAFDQFKSEAHLNVHQWLPNATWPIPKLRERNQSAINSPEWLNDWVNFVRNRNDLKEKGLEKLWRLTVDQELDVDKVQKALHLAVFDQLSREILKQKPHLSRTSGKNLNTDQRRFREYDQKLKTLQRERIASVVAKHQAPGGRSGGRKSEYTDLALIHNELGKKTKHIPIRQLINRASDALVELKPCFMMSPMSAAHYLNPGQLPFDLVVMDEASQVKPEDALGVIARGKQLVVVGDPKQLPPTSFFDRQDLDGEDDEESAALAQTDSILDAALPLFNMRRLRWHYRSQHESLITFSNQKFYNNDLVIFPSPHAKAPEYGVKFSYVKGGRFVNQHNVEEASVVAKAVAKHALNHPNESLGIVAMSSKQRDQIERAVEEACKQDSEVQEAVEQLKEKEDGLFIKNLENVQGDERDVIFISCTYGPSEVGGRVFQRFGPINSDVGWRRLNVLFTRSKKRMHVFSSMKAEDVKVDNAPKKGVMALHQFLSFAEHGSLKATPVHSGREPDSDFEIAVIDALSEAGFECEAQVGVAGFFIDIAVKDPGNSGRYLMGIECDGATYHSAKSARDRDRLRQEVLEHLGWRIRRIWSTDWFTNPDGELQPIIRELHDLKTVVHEDPSEYEFDAGPIEAPSAEQNTDNEEVIYDTLTEVDSLRGRLEYFAENVIKKKFPDTPSDKKLLRPAMIEALIEYEPVSLSEFQEVIPEYVRKGTDRAEARTYLTAVLEIVAGSEESEIVYEPNASG